MLVSFAVQNFRSIADRQELTFVASRYKGEGLPVLHCEQAKYGIVPLLAIFGANGAGKTNMLSALKFLREAVVFSQTIWPPLRPVKYQPNLFSPNEDSTFEATFYIDRKLYKYGFSCNQSGFTEEWLYEGRKTIYRRHGSKINFGEAYRGSKASKAFMRENSLFISAAAQSNHSLLSRIYKWFGNWDDIDHVRDSERAFTIHLLRDPANHQFLQKSLAVLNPDIVGLELKSDEPQATGPDTNTYVRDLRAWEDVRVLHKSPKTGQISSLPVSAESRGTQDYFALVSSILLVLEQGGLLILDEAGASLHPMLLKAIISLFQGGRTNPFGAQIVIGTHETTILCPELLRPDEVWFAEQRVGTSVYYSLADFEGVRSETKAQRLYLEGRFGAVPFLEDHLSLFEAYLSKETLPSHA